MRRSIRALPLALALAAAPAAAGDEPLPGFDAAGSAAQRALEAEFDAGLDAGEMRRWLRDLAARPHHAGSAGGRRNAEYLKRLFESWGYDTAVESYEVLLPVPRTRRLEMLAPRPFRASLVERDAEGDDGGAGDGEFLPPYNAFSPDGDVEAELVYANYGLREDYERLERHGIDVAGKIVIVRYGRSFRGVKPKLAAERGAVGCLIYSDPADDGYAQGEVYPEGPFKNDSGVQRGSILDVPRLAGDPRTPGWAAVRGARRLDLDDTPGLPDIPTLPLSYADARPLLDALEGPVAPPEWRGALPIVYRLGPGPARVRLALAFDWRPATVRNVVARREGADRPDEWIVRGNHHDAWVHGARDPVSGLVALLAEARAVSRLSRPPARTLVYAAWDAEEPGLIGSTEWAEQHARELREKAVAYFNTDSSGRGFAFVGGSPTLEKFYDRVLRDVADPRTGHSVAERLRAQVRVRGGEKERADLEKRGLLRIAPLGSGSDFTPFLQHLGIASSNLAFYGESPNGSYHTRYDTVDHFERFVDPGHAYGLALARIAGRATLRMANAPLLPFDFAGLLDALENYVAEVEGLAGSLRERTARENRLVASGAYAAALDPGGTLRPPKPRPAVPHFDFSPLLNGLARIREALDGYRVRPGLDRETLAEVNRLLYTSERLLLREEGLPDRPWYRHQLYAPGVETGYGAKTLPAVREAIELRRYERVGPGVAALAEVFAALAARIEEIAALAEAAEPPVRSATP